MKRILHVGLLMSLQAVYPAHAYEADIHFSTTYVLARAVGWSEADAVTIASANEGVDENQHTVAALEMDTTASPSIAGFVTSSLRQADKNLRFHCFSKTRGRAGQIAADVREVMSHHLAGVPGHDDDPRKHTQRLIALGVALHCQQDAHSHVGFGGSCGSYPGSCHGHTHQTIVDQVVFRLVGKHYFNPDHPGVSGRQLLETLQGSASELAARRPNGFSRSIPTHELVALSNALRGSGLELPDEARMACNRYIAGKWLYDFFRSGRAMQVSARTVETVAPEVADTCKDASLASATMISIPDPRFPRLNRDASPYLVRADGTYQLVHDDAMNAALAGPPNYHAQNVKVQLSHWRQVLALPLMRRLGP